MKKHAIKLKNNSRENNLELIEHENYYPNELTIKTIEEIERGENLSGPYYTVEELMKDLMSDIDA